MCRHGSDKAHVKLTSRSYPQLPGQFTFNHLSHAIIWRILKTRHFGTLVVRTGTLDGMQTHPEAR